MGAAGRDFHTFNLCFRDNPEYEVVAFTAAQIPGIENRCYPASLSGPLYPNGIPIYAEEKLEKLILEETIHQVIFAYSDISHINLMHIASRVLASGADFRFIGPERSFLASSRPVISVCAVRTGCGKDSVVRKISALLRAQGLRSVVVRHPMPYGDLNRQAVQRFATVEDCDRQHCTIEEREEYEQHIAEGVVVYAGVDYAKHPRCGRETKPTSFCGMAATMTGPSSGRISKSFSSILIGRPRTALSSGETNLRRAQVIVVNKLDSAPVGGVQQVMANIAQINPKATVIQARSNVSVDKPDLVRGKRVLVIEDGPTLTHGEMGYGSGIIAAQRYGAAEIVDPRLSARGSLVEIFARYPWVGKALPAMGYSNAQLQDLSATINAAAMRHHYRRHSRGPGPSHCAAEASLPGALRPGRNQLARFRRRSRHFSSNPCSAAVASLSHESGPRNPLRPRGHHRSLNAIPLAAARQEN